MNNIDLAGRTAIVTGGAKGIGYAIAERLLRSGATVTLWDIDHARLADAATTLEDAGPVSSDIVDVTDADAICAAVVRANGAMGKIGVLVNAIAPGGTNTELFDDLSEEYRAAIVDGMELGRLLEPPEIAALAAWLASEDCSYSTGAVFDISGGRADY